MTPTIKPEPKQHLAYQKLQDSITRFIFFGGGAGGGKSWLGCEWLITNCYFYPESKWFIGRKELKRLMTTSYITFLKVCKYHQIPRDDWNLNSKYNFIEFINGSAKGSRIDLIDFDYKPSDPDYERFGSLELTGGWNEEAGEMQFKAFDVLKSRVGRHLNKEYGLLPKILNTCNPTKNWIYPTVYKPWKDRTLAPAYAFIQALYADNTWTAEEYGKQLSEITDEATRERLMFGNWEYDDDPSALIDYEAIIDLFTNTVTESNEKYLTVDAARYGGDKIVYTRWKGLKAYKITWKQRQGTDKTEEDIKQVLADEQIPRSHTLVDEDGIGGGIVDHLKGIKGFTANSTPFEVWDTHKLKKVPANFESLKAQCSYKLADVVNNREMAIECEDPQIREWLTQELEWIKSKDADKDGKKKILPKDEVKEHIGRSPDFSDTLMMRMYFELKKTPIITPITGVQGGVKPFYPSLGI